MALGFLKVAPDAWETLGLGSGVCRKETSVAESSGDFLSSSITSAVSDLSAMLIGIVAGDLSSSEARRSGT